MFRWLIQQRYVLANPFAGIKVRGSGRATALEASRAFTEGEWLLVRTIADGLEWSYGWEITAAQRLRFVLDFGYATGLRASELVGATLGDIETDSQGDHWLRVVGKGSRSGLVTMPPLARSALDRYLVERSLPVTRNRWRPGTPLIDGLGRHAGAGITSTRLGHMLRQFFSRAAELIQSDHPAVAEKLRRASLTGCGTLTPPMHWRAVWNCLRCGTICDMHRFRQRLAIFMEMTRSVRDNSVRSSGTDERRAASELLKEEITSARCPNLCTEPLSVTCPNPRPVSLTCAEMHLCSAV